MAKSSSQGWALDREGDAERNQAVKQRKYEEARLKFEEAERLTTDESDRAIYRDHQALMLQKLGDILHSNADYTGAIQKYDAAIALTNDKAYHVDKATSLIELDRYQEAITSSEEALRLDSDYNLAKDIKATALCSQGWALDREADAEGNEAVKQRKYEEARLKFEEAERLTTDECDRDIYIKNQALMLNRIGCALDQEGKDEGNQAVKQIKYEEARLKFEEAERLTTDESDRTLYRKNQALMLKKLGDILDEIGSTIQLLSDIEYDNPLLNDSSFLQLFTKTYGMSATSRLIDLTTVLTEDHREELKEIVSDPGAIEILGNLIGEQYDFS